MSMMGKADLIDIATREKHGEVGGGVQSSIIQVRALGLRHKDGAAEAWSQLVFSEGNHKLSACKLLSFVSFASGTETVQAQNCAADHDL